MNKTNVLWPLNFVAEIKQHKFNRSKLAAPFQLFFAAGLERNSDYSNWFDSVQIQFVTWSAKTSISFTESSTLILFDFQITLFIWEVKKGFQPSSI